MAKNRQIQFFFKETKQIIHKINTRNQTHWNKVPTTNIETTINEHQHLNIEDDEYFNDNNKRKILELLFWSMTMLSCILCR